MTGNLSASGRYFRSRLFVEHLVILALIESVCSMELVECPVCSPILTRLLPEFARDKTWS